MMNYYPDDSQLENELYQALSDTILEDESDFLSDSSLFKGNVYNTNQAAGVFFNASDFAFEAQQQQQQASLFSHPILNNSSSHAYTFPAFTGVQAAPAIAAPSSLFQDSFNDIDEIDFASGKKRPLDEFDEFVNNQSNDLFPDEFQKRKIAKRPMFPPSFGTGFPSQPVVSSTNTSSVTTSQLSTASHTHRNITIQTPLSIGSSTVESPDSSLPASPFAALSLAFSKVEPAISSLCELTNGGSDGDLSGNSSFIRKWTAEEDELLTQAVNECGSMPPKCWKAIAKKVPGRNEQQCLQRWRNVIACQYRKGVWTAEEDDVLRQCYEQFSGVSGGNFHFIKRVPRTWDQLAAERLNRTAKQCRERWANILDPNLRNDEFTEEEDKRIISLHEQHGNKWKKIASFLDGRTGNRVKSRFYSLTRKTVSEQSCE